MNNESDNPRLALTDTHGERGPTGDTGDTGPTGATPSIAPILRGIVVCFVLLVAVLAFLTWRDDNRQRVTDEVVRGVEANQTQITTDRIEAAYNGCLGAVVIIEQLNAQATALRAVEQEGLKNPDISEAGKALLTARIIAYTAGLIDVPDCDPLKPPG
jgi:hypothetical protein